MPITIIEAPAATETLIFDPVSEDASNAPLTIVNSIDYGLLEHSYPAPPLDTQQAGSADTEGDRIASRRYRNRTITMTVNCGSYNALSALQAKVAKIAREGGTLQRTLPWGETITFDLLIAPGYDPAFNHVFEAGVTTVPLTFEALPHGRGSEETMTLRSETTLPVLVFTETGVKGDVPALGRLVIDLQASTDQYRLWWAMQSRYYDSASTASLFYQAETLTVGDIGALAVGSAGASGSGSNVMKATNVGSTWESVVLLYPSGSSGATHVGTYRVFARCFAPTANTGPVQARLIWSAPNTGSDVWNDPVTVGEGAWYFLDLGSVTIARDTVGVHRWYSWIATNSSTPSDDLEVDYVVFMPTDEAYGSSESTTTTAVDPTRAFGGRVVISHETVLTGDVGGQFGRPLVYEGDYLLVPPAGDEGRSVRFVLKSARSLAGDADTNIDDISAQLHYTPRYLAVPST